MATRSRIGIVLEDDSILSAYHHWDGYPEWLGVTLKKHYNTDEKVAELIDGGNMSTCWSTRVWDDEKQGYVDKETYSPEYYVEEHKNDNEIPILSKSLGELVEIDMGEEYVYLWFMGEWNCYSVSRRHDDEWNIVDTSISPVMIPDEYPVREVQS